MRSITVAALLLIFSAKAAALSIAPASVKIEGKPGKHATLSFRVSGKNNEVIELVQVSKLHEKGTVVGSVVVPDKIVTVPIKVTISDVKKDFYICASSPISLFRSCSLISVTPNK